MERGKCQLKGLGRPPFFKLKTKLALAEKVITAEKIHIILLIDGINDLYLANYIITVVM